MRRLISLLLIILMIGVLVLFGFVQGPGQLAFMSIVFLFSVFVFSFYLMTLISDSPPKSRAEKFPPLTILVPAYNMEATIGKCLEHVCAMRYPSKPQILVLDDASTDRTAEIARRFPVQVITRKGNRGKAAALNFGIAKAKGELIACIDSDTYPPGQLLLESVPYLHSKDVGAVTFFVTANNPRTIWQKMQEIEYFSAFGFIPFTMEKINSILVTPGPLTIFRADVLRKVGGYDEKNITEDFEMGLKLVSAHHRILYLPIRVPTEVPASFSAFMRQRIRWYRGTVFNIYLYRRLLFSRQHHDAGLFAFPVTGLYVLITYASFFFILSRLLQSLSQLLSQGYFTLLYQPGIHLAFDPLYIRADWLLFPIFLSLWAYFIIRSVLLINQKFKPGHAPGLLMLFLVYPIINSLFYIYSLYKELTGSEQQW